MDILAELESTKAALEKANGELATLTANEASAKAELEAARNAAFSEGVARGQAEAELATAKAEINSLQANATLSAAEIEKLKAEAKTVDQKVLEITGKKGGEAAQEVHKGTKQNTISHAEFNALDPYAQDNFLKEGGKLS